MSTLRIQAPGGKTLAVQIAEGTDPAQYDAIVDDVMKDYAANMNPRDLDPLEAKATKWDTEANPAADLALTADALHGGAKLAMSAPAIIKSAPGVIRGLAEGAGDLGETLAAAGGKVANVVRGGWDAVTGNTPRGFGYAKGVLSNPAMREGAADAIEMANKAQPELGKMVSEAGAPANALPPPGGMEAPDAFQTPIRQGILSGPEDMFNAAETQRKAVGQAIEQTLGKYDATQTFYDPSTVNEAVKGMLERDASGQVMTTGWQGEVNDAMKKALSSLSDFSQGGPIKWSDAARIKTGLQTMGDYAAKNSEMANEAYKQVASLLKNDIDAQAAEMLAKQGGNVEAYQSLRQAYGKLESLSQALNNRMAAKTANSTIPWWVKMAAGGYLSGKALGVAKGMTGH